MYINELGKDLSGAAPLLGSLNWVMKLLSEETRI